MGVSRYPGFPNNSPAAFLEAPSVRSSSRNRRYPFERRLNDRARQPFRLAKRARRENIEGQIDEELTRDWQIAASHRCLQLVPARADPNHRLFLVSLSRTHLQG